MQKDNDIRFLKIMTYKTLVFASLSLAGYLFWLVIVTIFNGVTL